MKDPHSIISRSLYKTQIENYLKYIPRERIKFIVFEDFIKEPNAALKEISKFLNINFKNSPQTCLIYTLINQCTHDIRGLNYL